MPPKSDMVKRESFEQHITAAIVNAMRTAGAYRVIEPVQTERGEEQ